MVYEACSILAIDISPFGKSLALLPALRELRASYPQTLITAAASGGHREIRPACGLVYETISLGIVKPAYGGLGNVVKKLTGLVRVSRHSNFDLVLDFSPTVETQLFSRVVLRARV